MAQPAASVHQQVLVAVHLAGAAMWLVVMCHHQAVLAEELRARGCLGVGLLGSHARAGLLGVDAQRHGHVLLGRVGAGQRDIGRQVLVRRGVDDRLLQVVRRRGSGFSQARQHGSSQQAGAWCTAVQGHLVHGDFSRWPLWGRLQLRTHTIREDELLPEWLAMHELNRE